MASGKLYNLAKMNTSTTGTGTVTLSTAVSGFLSFADSGVSNGEVVTYVIEEGANREIGYGTYTSSGTTLTRNVLKSTNSDSAIDLSGSATVGITAARENFLEWFADIDANGFDLGMDDNTGINDDSGNETVRFRKTSSAVNYIEILNTETGVGPQISAAGDDTDVDLRLAGKGSGSVVLPAAAAKFGESTPFSDSSGTLTLQNIDAIDATTKATLSSDLGLTSQNLLINGDGAIAQRTTLSSIADDAYHVDRWYALNQTSTLTASTVSLASDGVPSLIRLTQDNATAQRIGSAQIVAAGNSQVLRGQSVVLSGKVRMSSSATVRFAILEWTGTADSVTSDWVNDWTSATYTAGNFFKSTTTTVTATGSLALTANTLTDFSLTGTVSSSANNVAVMIWSSATMAQNDTLDFRAQLEIGSVATEWSQRTRAHETALCLSYYEQIDFGSAASFAIVAGRSTSNVTGVLPFYPKRIVPTVGHNGVGNFDVLGVGAETISSVTLTPTKSLAECVVLTSNTPFSNGTAYVIQGKAGCIITIDAEL